MGALPRRLARSLGEGIGKFAFHLLKRLRVTGIRNLRLAFPQWSEGDVLQVLRKSYRNLGLLLAEFCLMSHYSAVEASESIRYEGN